MLDQTDDTDERAAYRILIQAVEALGHGMMIDEVTLDQVVAYGNVLAKGVKCRFTHPGLSSDGLGSLLIVAGEHHHF